MGAHASPKLREPNIKCLAKDLRITILYKCIKRKKRFKKNDDSVLGGERHRNGIAEKARTLLPSFALKGQL